MQCGTLLNWSLFLPIPTSHNKDLHTPVYVTNLRTKSGGFGPENLYPFLNLWQTFGVRMIEFLSKLCSHRYCLAPNSIQIWRFRSQ